MQAGTHGAPSDLVLIGGTNAALGRPDARGCIFILAQGLKLTVEREDQGCVLGNAQSSGRHDDALLLQLGNFVDQGLWVDHYTVADNGKFGFPHNSGRQQ